VSRALVRFARRLANWEDPNLSVDLLQEREFKARDGGPDLRPSVYEIDVLEPRVVQTYAEHAHKIDPPQSALALDVAVVVPGELAVTRGDTPFRFTQEQHREILLRDRAELLAFIKATTTVPQRTVAKREVHDYVRTRLDAADPEWKAVASEPNAKSWVRKLVAGG
jgi:hypothetical protein